MSTTNTRTTAPATMTEAEEKAMALMQHLKNDYFICNGQLYIGTEEKAKEEYNTYCDEITADIPEDEKHEPLKTFEEWTEENINWVDASLDGIEAEGYKVCTANDPALCKDVIGTEKINDTMYFICKLERASNPEHTPGPWKIESLDDEHTWIMDSSSKKYLAEIITQDDNGNIVPTQNQTANAKLIAAAPELLETVKMLYLLLEENQGEAKWYLRKHFFKIREAVNKATGEILT